MERNNEVRGASVSAGGGAGVKTPLFIRAEYFIIFLNFYAHIS